jgi:hypothetical protein
MKVDRVVSALVLATCPAPAIAALLLSEDFGCASMGCNSSHGITNYSYWRWSTTGSQQSHMDIRNASHGRRGNEIEFSVKYCPPPNPNPHHAGCYRSELALQRSVENSLIDWAVGKGSSRRWFGFSNRLVDFAWDTTDPLNGPSFQLHGAGGLPQYKALHPVLNLQVDATGCSLGNASCPVWTVGVSAGGRPNPACSEQYDACWKLGPALVPDSPFGLGAWNDWVIEWQGSPTSKGYLQIWRNGKLVLPAVKLATAYNDTIGPYVKFGVYHSHGKAKPSRQPMPVTAQSRTVG